MQVRREHKYQFRNALPVLVKASPVRACLSLFSGRNRPRFVVLALFALVVISSSVIASLQQVNAVTKTGDLASTADMAKSFTYYKALRHCMNAGSYANSYFFFPAWIEVQDMNQDNATSFEWFSDQAATVTSLVRVDNTVTTGVINDAKDDGITNCGGSNGKAWIAAAATLWGYTSGPQLLCDLGFTREVKGSTCAATPSGASNKFIAPDNAASKLDDFWKTKLGNNSLGIGSIAIGGEYRLYVDSFVAACLPSSISYTIQTFAIGATTPTSTTYQASSQGKDGGTNVRLYQDTDISCQDLVAKISKADAPAVLGYKQYLKAHNGNDGSRPQGNCLPGSTDPACATSSASSCGSIVNGVGWIICPVVDMLAGLDDAMWGLVSTLLTVSPIQAGDLASVVWATFRSFANVLLVVVFLIVIFSQLTSVGLSNFGVKKLLPRLIIAAILINVSFFIVQISVDVFNILGSGIYNILGGIADSARPVPTWGALINLLTGVGTGTLAIVAGVALAGGAQAAFFLLLPVALVAALGFLTAMIVLIFRQAVIPILAVLAPLAFVAYMLPNTEQWFKKWRSMFFSMLMLYPTAALLFGGVKLSAIMIVGDGGDWWRLLIGLIMLGAPLFMLPFIARQGGPLLGKLGSALNGLASKTRNPVGKWAGSHADRAKAEYDARPGSRWNMAKRVRQSFDGRRRRRELETSAYQSQQQADFTRTVASNGDAWADGLKGEAAQSFMRGAASRAEAEELKTALQPLIREIAQVRASGGDVDRFLTDRATSTTHSSAEQNAAMHQAAALGRDDVIRNLQSTLPPARQTQLQEAITANAGALLGKAPDIVKGGPGPAFGNVTGDQLAKFSAGTAASHMRYLEGLHASATAPGATPADRLALDAAVQSFNSAVEDITRDSLLQASFGSDTGTRIERTIAASASSAFRAYAGSTMTGLAAIQADGKIR